MVLVRLGGHEMGLIFNQCEDSLNLIILLSLSKVMPSGSAMGNAPRAVFR
jgi:hypothetical protein